MKTCKACRITTVQTEFHHMIPLEYGGKYEGQTIELCGNCHNEIHRLAENPEVGSPPQHLETLVNLIVRSKELFHEGKLKAEDSRENMIRITEDDKKIILFLKNRWGCKSIKETITRALAQAVKSQ